MSPALETPPPITKTSGSTTPATFAKAVPSTVQSLSTSSNATSSPSFATSKISFAVNGSKAVNFVVLVSV